MQFKIGNVIITGISPEEIKKMLKEGKIKEVRPLVYEWIEK